MRKEIDLLIIGQPIANKRHRSLRNSNVQYDPQKKEKAIVRNAMIEQIHKLPKLNMYLFNDCVYFDQAQFFEVYLRYYMKAPKAFHTAIKRETERFFVCHKKPDLDNMDKFYLDCMTGIVYPDDAMIVSLTSVKYYSMQPRTEIWVTAHFRDVKEPYRWGKTLC